MDLGLVRQTDHTFLRDLRVILEHVPMSKTPRDKGIALFHSLWTGMDRDQGHWLHVDG